MEAIIAGLFLALVILELIVELALNEMNMSYIQKEKESGRIPDFFQDKMSPEDYRKSTDYTLGKGRFERWAGVYGAMVTLFVLFGGVLPYLDHLSGGNRNLNF